MDFTQQIEDFREDFPEFPADIYTDELLGRAFCSTDIEFGTRWGEYLPCSIYRIAWQNLVAHTVLLSYRASISVGLGGIPGATRGTDSYSIGDVSEVQGSQIMLKLQPWDDAYATTPYGVRYMELRNRVGQGVTCI